MFQREEKSGTGDIESNCAIPTMSDEEDDYVYEVLSCNVVATRVAKN